MKVKADYIEELTKKISTNYASNENDEVEINEQPNDKTVTGQNDDISRRNTDQKQKCNSCDYQTSVPRHLQSHKLAHEGQYQCQRGCKKVAFKTVKLLDEHIKLQHSNIDVNEYPCDMCDSEFTAQFQLRQHKTKKHANINVHTSSNCLYCGQIFTYDEDLKNHLENCDGGFSSVKSKECHYYNRGGCRRGDACRFTHIKQRDERIYPECRNGPRCRYMASGVCNFFHAGVGIQNPRHQEDPQQSSSEQEGRKFCRFLEDCSRVPNCPFLHSEQDFPRLPRRASQDWEEY